jgi:hypothetical protein
VGAQVGQPGHGVGRGGDLAGGEPPQRRRRGGDRVEPLAAAAQVVSVGAPVDVGMQRQIGLPHGQVHDRQGIPGPRFRADMARRVAPHEARCAIGERVDAVRRGEKLREARRIERVPQAREVDLRELNPLRRLHPLRIAQRSRRGARMAAMPRTLASAGRVRWDASMTAVLQPPPAGGPRPAGGRPAVSAVDGAEPRRARHGVPRGQIDISARVISIFERLGWASEVRWTNPERLARIAARR